LFEARVCRIEPQLGFVRLDVHLAWHVRLEKSFAVEGVVDARLPGDVADRAHHCLVVLLGGKSVLVHVDPTDGSPRPLARLYLDEKVVDPPQELLWTPHQSVEPRLAVAPFFRWLAGREFDHRQVLNIINRRKSA
jgi:hypothetical protein